MPREGVVLLDGKRVLFGAIKNVENVIKLSIICDVYSYNCVYNCVLFPQRIRNSKTYRSGYFFYNNTKGVLTHKRIQTPFLCGSLRRLVYAGDHACGERGSCLAEDEPPHRLALGVQLHAHRPLKLDQYERTGVRAQAARLDGGGLAVLV